MSGRAKRSNCPRCGSSDVLRIVYGLPADTSAAGYAEARREGIAFGGCCIEPENPTHQCAACEHEWKDRRRERAEQEEAELADRPTSDQ